MVSILILLGCVIAGGTLFTAGFFTGRGAVMARMRAMALAEKQRNDAFIAGIASKKSNGLTPPEKW